MKSPHDTIVDLVREHERAHHEHELAVTEYNKNPCTDTHKAMLSRGCTASGTGGRLHGFILGLLVIATVSQYHTED